MYCFQPPSPSKYSISTLSSSLSCSLNKARKRVKPMCMKNQCSREREGKEKKVGEKKVRKRIAPQIPPRFFFYYFFILFLSFSYFLFFFHSVSLPPILILFLVCFQEPFLLEFIGSGDPTIWCIPSWYPKQEICSRIVPVSGATFFITVTVQPRMNKKKFSGMIRFWRKWVPLREKRERMKWESHRDLLWEKWRQKDNDDDLGVYAPEVGRKETSERESRRSLNVHFHPSRTCIFLPLYFSVSKCHHCITYLLRHHEVLLEGRNAERRYKWEVRGGNRETEQKKKG